MAGLPQAFAQGAGVKKPLLIFNASATHKLGYAQIFVAAEIRACLLGHSFGKFLGSWFFEVAQMLGVSKAVPGEADYRAESRRGGQASMINVDLPLCSLHRPLCASSPSTPSLQPGYHEENPTTVHTACMFLLNLVC